jgi:hypothetical protein
MMILLAALSPMDLWRGSARGGGWRWGWWGKGEGGLG